MERQRQEEKSRFIIRAYFWTDTSAKYVFYESVNGSGTIGKCSFCRGVVCSYLFKKREFVGKYYYTYDSGFSVTFCRPMFYIGSICTERRIIRSRSNRNDTCRFLTAAYCGVNLPAEDWKNTRKREMRKGMDMEKVCINRKKIIVFLSFLIAILSIITTTTGIFSNQIKEYDDIITVFGENIQLYQKGLYARDSVSMASQALAQDVVTLILAVPLVLISLWMLKKQNGKGMFLLTGTIGYFLYTYASYSFLLIFNSFYLLYVILMTLSFYAFILCLLELNQLDIKELITQQFPGKLLSGFFLVSALMIMGMWLSRIVPALLTGSAPTGLEHYSTLGIQTLDLGFVVPACIVTAYLLRKENKFGYLLATVFVVKMVTMTAAVSAMTVFMKKNGVSVGIGEQVVFVALFLISCFFLIKMFKEMRA